MNQIKTLIIDDEQLAREVIKGYLKEEADIEIVGECSNGFEGFKQISALQPDLVFLDVMMPKLTGIEMLELVEEPPVVVFSTAHDDYAIKAFEHNAIDYLLKPYSKDRFLSALSKAREKLQNQQGNKEAISNTIEMQHQDGEVLTRVAVRTGSKIDIIAVDDIQFLEAQDDYVKLHTRVGNFLKQQTMKYYETHLSNEFLRIHRSYIIRLSEIEKVELLGKDTHQVLLRGGQKLTVSRSGYAKLKEALNF